MTLIVQLVVLRGSISALRIMVESQSAFCVRRLLIRLPSSYPEASPARPLGRRPALAHCPQERLSERFPNCLRKKGARLLADNFFGVFASGPFPYFH